MASVELSVYECPHCKANVMKTGFTVVSRAAKSYMAFVGRGPIQIATQDDPPHGTECMACGKALPIDPVELMRIA